jgi:CDP-diacylglycerol--glycerol-3-phosphate 3-phosphatidyltransferase
MFFIFLKGLFFKFVALLIFIVACWTDYYDGKLAFKLNVVSDFGKLMDPIADKILIVAAFLSFVQMQIIPAWMVVIIILREFLITGLRLFALGKGKVIAASKQAKHKTVSQMVTIFFILGFLILKEILIKFSFWNQTLAASFQLLIYISMFITVILTVISGMAYFWQNRKLIVKI